MSGDPFCSLARTFQAKFVVRINDQGTTCTKNQKPCRYVQFQLGNCVKDYLNYTQALVCYVQAWVHPWVEAPKQVATGLPGTWDTEGRTLPLCALLHFHILQDYLPKNQRLHVRKPPNASTLELMQCSRETAVAPTLGSCVQLRKRPAAACCFHEEEANTVCVQMGVLLREQQPPVTQEWHQRQQHGPPLGRPGGAVPAYHLHFLVFTSWLQINHTMWGNATGKEKGRLQWACQTESTMAVECTVREGSQSVAEGCCHRHTPELRRRYSGVGNSRLRPPAALSVGSGAPPSPSQATLPCTTPTHAPLHVNKSFTF